MADPITGTIPDDNEEPWGEELRVLLTQLRSAGNQAAADLLNRLTISGNLSDVPNKTVARNNLSVYSRAEIDEVMNALAYFSIESETFVTLLLRGAVTDPDPTDGKISLASGNGQVAEVLTAGSAVSRAMMGAALGVATLDNGTKIPVAQIPALEYASPQSVVDRVNAGALVARPADFAGIDPTGVALSTAGLRLALAAAINLGVPLLIPPGYYRLNGALTNLVDTFARDATVVAARGAIFEQTTNVFAFDAYASAGAIYSVSSMAESMGNTTATGGDTDTVNIVTFTLPAGSNPGYKLGDRVKLLSDSEQPGARPTGDGVTARRMGADFEVYQCVGDTVTVIGSLEPYTVDGGSFSLNPRLVRLTAERVSWTGGTFLTNDTAGKTVGHIRMTGLREPSVSDVTVLSAAGQAVQMRGCYHYRVSGIKVGYATNNPSTGSLGYALLDSSSSYGLATDLDGRFVRHVYTDDSNAIAANATDIASIAHYGFTWKPVVNGVTAVGTISEAVSPHAHSRGGVFRGLQAVGCAGGFGARGARHTFMDSVIESCDTGIVEFTEDGRATMCAGMSYVNIRMRKIRQNAIRLNKNYNGPSVGTRITEATKFTDVIVEDAKAGTVLIVNSSIALFGSGIQIYVNQTLGDAQSFVDIDSSTVRGPGEIGLNVYGINSGSNLIFVRTLQSTGSGPGSWRGPSLRLYGSTSQNNRFGYVISGLPDFQFEGYVYLENVISRARFIASRGTGSLLDYKVGGGSGESAAYFPVPDSFITDATQEAWLATLDAPVLTLAVNFLNLDTDGTTPKYLHKMGAPNRAGQIRHVLNSGTVNGRVGHGSSAYGTNLKMNGTTPTYREIIPNEQISLRWVNGAWKQFA